MGLFYILMDRMRIPCAGAGLVLVGCCSWLFGAQALAAKDIPQKLKGERKPSISAGEIHAFLAPHVEAVVITQPAVQRAMEPEEVADAARRVLSRVEVVPDPSEALARAQNLARPDGAVLVAGSLYLVGQVLSELAQVSVPGPVSM